MTSRIELSAFEKRRILVLSPFGVRVNPYISLFCDGLTAAGAEVRLAPRLGPAELTGNQRPDVIHLHWLDRYDLPPAFAIKSLSGARDWPRRALRRLGVGSANARVVYQFRRWLRLRRFFGYLARFRCQGGRVAFTVHNLQPHDEAGLVDRWGVAEIVRLADVIHAHDASTAAALRDRFGAQRVVVVPHGHYLAAYPNEIGRAAARARLGLPDDAFVFVCLGLLRPYKGLEELLPAFRMLPGAGSRLLLAGEPGVAGYAEKLMALAAGDARIRLDPRLVPAEEVQVYLNAADVAVLPYRQITTSGAALLAFSFGLPIVAPAIGAFPGLIAGQRGILYDPARPTGLSEALAQACQMDWHDGRAEIRAWVGQFDWTAIGAALLAAYQTSCTSTDSTGSTSRNPCAS